MTIDVEKEYKTLSELHGKMDALLAWPDQTLFATNEEVSDWSSAEHVYHASVALHSMLRAIGAIARGSEAVKQEGDRTREARYVLTHQQMPRGRAEAPSFARPPGALDREEVEQTLARSREALQNLKPLLASIPEQSGWVEHPYLGPLRADEWLRLARVHTRHHLALI